MVGQNWNEYGWYKNGLNVVGTKLERLWLVQNWNECGWFKKESGWSTKKNGMNVACLKEGMRSVHNEGIWLVINNAQ